jgi:hypothetical protein
MLVSPIQETVLKQQAALCNFRGMEITVHECMIVGQYLQNLFNLPNIATIGADGKQGLLTEAMRRDGFKGKQHARMMSAATMFLSMPEAQKGKVA